MDLGVRGRWHRVGASRLDLDAFGIALADQQLMLAADIADDRLVHGVTGERNERAGTTPPSESTAISVVRRRYRRPSSPPARQWADSAPIAAATGSAIR